MNNLSPTPNLRNIKPLKLIAIKQPEQIISVEYDIVYKRFFYFENSTQQLVIYGTKNQEEICRLKVKHHRYNPLLYFHRVKENSYLMVIGGFESKG